mgnify:FL=1
MIESEGVNVWYVIESEGVNVWYVIESEGINVWYVIESEGVNVWYVIESEGVNVWYTFFILLNEDTFKTIEAIVTKRKIRDEYICWNIGFNSKPMVQLDEIKLSSRMETLQHGEVVLQARNIS